MSGICDIGSFANLFHLFSTSIFSLVFQSNIHMVPSLRDLARKSIVPAIGVGRNGLNTILSTPNTSSRCFIFGTMSLIVLNVRISFSPDGSFLNLLPSKMSSQHIWHRVPYVQLSSRFLSQRFLSSAGVIPSLIAHRSSIFPSGSNSGKTVHERRAGDVFYLAAVQCRRITVVVFSKRYLTPGRVLCFRTSWHNKLLCSFRINKFNIFIIRNRIF